MSHHTENRSRGVAWRLATILIATSILWPGSAGAGGFLTPGKTGADEEVRKLEYVAPAKRMDVAGDGVDALIAELKNAETRVREAWQNAWTAEQEYTRARTRRYPRGAALEEIKQRTYEMGREQVTAELDFSKIVDKARRGGVPMGTLAPFMDLELEIGRRQQGRTSGDR